MAVVLEALASYIQNMVREMAQEEVNMLFGVLEAINKMDIKLRDLKYFLADADRRNITDDSVQAWVREIRDAMYDATNIVDICQLKAMERGKSNDAGCLNPLLFCMRNPLHAHKIGSRIKNLNKRLEEIKKRSLAFNFNLSSYEDHSRRVTSCTASRETSGELDESSLVGENIEEDTRNLVELLTTEDLTKSENNIIMVFAIVGVGGIGKTTLAQKIFNNETIQQEFSKKIWLSVNQDFNGKELLRRAIIEAGGDHQSTGNMRTTLERALKDALYGQKILLVMDDVWDPQAWEGVLETPLVNAALANGSRVLVTTRYVSVARGVMAKKPYHHVNKLDPEDAWLLLKKQVAGNENTEPEIDRLKSIGMGIIAKCDHLPLAVKVMGGLLRQKRKTPGDWQKVLNDTAWSITEMPEELNYSVSLSYEDLHPSLKQCFLHFSMLPRAPFIFNADDVVGMWISEGFVHGNSQDLQELGREYYNELLSRNLIEPKDLWAGQFHCKMHDLVRSFGQYVARDEVLISHMGETDIASKLNSHRFIRWLSLSQQGSESIVEWSSLKPQKSVRTLVSIRCIKATHRDSLVTFSNIRTLHLDSINCDGLVGTLYELKHLRYLSMDRCGLSKLPENIGKMKFLQHIRISRNESLGNLPNSITELHQLRALYLHDTKINNIPRGFSALTNLRNLEDFPAHMDDDGRCSLQELGPLSQLSVLGIDGLENVCASSFATMAMLDKKLRLSSLNLKCNTRQGDDGQLVTHEGQFKEQQKRIEEVFDELSPPSSIEWLRIHGYFGQRLPRWMMSIADAPLGNLRTIIMHDLANCTELPDGLCQFPCLESLEIVRAPAIKRVGSEFLQPNHRRHSHSQESFSRLSKMNLNGLVEWEEWEWDEQIKAMPILEELGLRNCKLKNVPPGLASNARALKKLFVHGVMLLRSLENFASVVHLEVFRNTDLERISNLPKLQKLAIIKCPKLKVLKGIPALQRLELKDYDVEIVPGYLQDVKPRHLLLHCSLSLLTCIAAGKSGPECYKLSHIEQVKAYADDGGIPRKWYVMYTRDPYRFDTNISRSEIAQGRKKRTLFPYMTTCTIEDDWPVGRHASTAVKRQPLCVRFRCNAYRYLVPWLRRECLHCNEAARIASRSNNQWTEAAEHPAAGRITGGRYRRQQRHQNGTSRV